MSKLPPRIMVYPRDVANITGLSMRSAQRILHKVRVLHSKKGHDLVTVEELCHYLNLKESVVKTFL
jgi:hypothetical protein